MNKALRFVSHHVRARFSLRRRSRSATRSRRPLVAPYASALLLSTLLVALALSPPAAHAVTYPDSDGDGLLDLLDHPNFIPNATGRGNYDHCGIEDLDGAGQLVGVLNLDLYNNPIMSLESGDFSGLSNLQYLTLDRNAITNIEPGAFSGLSNLQTLLLRTNPIVSIQPGAFNGLSNLKELYLSSNHIRRLEPSVFSDLSNLRHLNLYDNAITSLESGDFNGLSNLQRLYLSHNAITSLESGDFNGLSNLQRLYLRYNALTSLESDGFSGLGDLRHLRLSYNAITSIESDGFSGLENLQALYLNDNALTSLESGAFSGLGNVSSLDISDNHELTELNFASATFGDLDNLTVDSEDITSLILDEGMLSAGAFAAILSGTNSIDTASLVGLEFSDSVDSLAALVGIGSLDEITIDPDLYETYQDELDDWDAISGNVLTVVPEPSTLMLLVVGCALLCFRRRGVMRD